MRRAFESLLPEAYSLAVSARPPVALPAFLVAGYPRSLHLVLLPFLGHPERLSYLWLVSSQAEWGQ